MWTNKDERVPSEERWFRTEQDKRRAEGGRVARVNDVTRQCRLGRRCIQTDADEGYIDERQDMRCTMRDV